ncbi:TPA: hypothetical protein QCO65_001188 [Bacillus cereus]|uniref:hypothetical protein n=1 Tax=Bacillus sp. FSL H8-0545 TaxID=2921402 RepID=UPI0030FA5394|nr:hypothetical protein [Bacillus cereus]HDR7612440.1 hypothetical protein [Bacillus mycoides]
MEFIKWEEKQIYKAISSKKYSKVIEFTHFLEKVLKNKCPFGLLMVKEQEDDIQDEKESLNALTNWLKDNKPLMGKYCLGIAMVVNDEEEFQKHEAVASKITSNIYGCPGAMFNNAEEAFEWLQDQIVNLK